jgi:hypothetical protein
MIQLEVPVKISMRLSALSVYGGSLSNLNKSHRLDHECHQGHRSRLAGRATRKDFRTTGHRYYRPWQSATVKSIKA